MNTQAIRHSDIVKVDSNTYTYSWVGPVRHEKSWGYTKATTEECRLTLRLTDGVVPSSMELEAGEEYVDIGLEFDGDMVDGYDGVMSFPPQAVAMLEALGYTVDESLK
jgi:hypothetical protein